MHSMDVAGKWSLMVKILTFTFKVLDSSILPKKYNTLKLSFIKLQK